MKQGYLSRMILTLILVLSISNSGLAQEKFEDDSDWYDEFIIYYDTAYYFFTEKIILDSAEAYLKKAINLAISSNDIYRSDTTAINLASSYNFLASLYRRLHNYNEALINYNEAERILKNVDPTNSRLGSIYHNKGNIYWFQNDMFKTKEYYEYALDFLTRNGYQNEYDFAFVYSNYLSLLSELGEYELAEEKLSMINIKSLDITPEIKLRILLTNASLYSHLHKYNQAEEQFKEAKRIVDDLKRKMGYTNDIKNYYYDLIDFHINNEEYEVASTDCNAALMFIESLDPQATRSKIIYRSDIEYRSATLQFRQGNYERALWIVNNTIQELNTFLDNLSSVGNISFKTKELATSLPDLFVLKSRVLFEIFKQTKDYESLVNSYEAYQKAIETLNFMKLTMSSEDSRFFATSQILEIYNEAIYVAKMLYDQTKDLSYLEQAFNFTETSKSFALYSEIKDMEAMEFSDLPIDIKQKESRLTGEIQIYEQYLYDEQIQTRPDSQKIADIKDELFQLKDDYDNLTQEIEANYENYYELKYNPKFVTLEEVQDKLAYRDALIEYVLSDSLLITYVIDKKGINAFSQEIGPEFAQECMDYYSLLNKQNFSRGVHQNYRRYVNLGYKFYKILVEPCLQYTDRKNFTIVPDGAITYIPFEGLITKQTDTEYINYLDLPYLIRDYSIGYTHSSTLMFSERLQSKSPEKKVLAFAPLYINPFDRMNSEQIRAMDDSIQYFLPLAGTIKEVQSIKETVPSRVFLNEQATEANFKKYAADYNVLHLAMHTLMVDDEPLYSLLAFTTAETDDTVEDNRLYAYEIYNMKLNAKMAVLSSCNTGSGKMQKGEGMMSLARGFIYAGCPSIVMTLWQVADKSSSEMMTSFYKYLKKGKSKQEAMRHAKIDYLSHADDLTSNPYFWSGFVVLGDNSPIYRKSGFIYWIAVIAVFAGVLIYLQYRKQ